MQLDWFLHPPSEKMKVCQKSSNIDSHSQCTIGFNVPESAVGVNEMRKRKK